MKGNHKVRFTNERIIQALKQTKGNISLAAEMLGCSRETIRQRAEKVKSVGQTLNDERDRVLDIAESMLYNKVLDGDMRAIEFALRTIGKARGYSEKVETVSEHQIKGEIIVRFDKQDEGL